MKLSNLASILAIVITIIFAFYALDANKTVAAVDNTSSLTADVSNILYGVAREGNFDFDNLEERAATLTSLRTAFREYEDILYTSENEIASGFKVPVMTLLVPDGFYMYYTDTVSQKNTLWDTTETVTKRVTGLKNVYTYDAGSNVFATLSWDGRVNVYYKDEVYSGLYSDVLHRLETGSSVNEKAVLKALRSAYGDEDHTATIFSSEENYFAALSEIANNTLGREMNICLKDHLYGDSNKVNYVITLPYNDENTLRSMKGHGIIVLYQGEVNTESANGWTDVYTMCAAEITPPVRYAVSLKDGALYYHLDSVDIGGSKLFTGTKDECVKYGAYPHESLLRD